MYLVISSFKISPYESHIFFLIPPHLSTIIRTYNVANNGVNAKINNGRWTLFAILVEGFVTYSIDLAIFFIVIFMFPNVLLVFLTNYSGYVKIFYIYRFNAFT